MAEVEALRQKMEEAKSRVELVLAAESVAAHRYTLDPGGFDDWHQAKKASRRAIKEFKRAQSVYIQALSKR